MSCSSHYCYKIQAVVISGGVGERKPNGNGSNQAYAHCEMEDIVNVDYSLHHPRELRPQTLKAVMKVVRTQQHEVDFTLVHRRRIPRVQGHMTSQ